MNETEYDQSAPFGCILNPGANRSRSLRRAEKIRQFLDKHYPGSRVFITASKEDIGAKVFEVSKSFGKILVCGGDGTINEVVQSALVTGAYIGIIPLGSGNDFVKTPGISRKIDKALKQLLTSKPIKADVIRYAAETERGEAKGVIANNLGIGFDGRANLEASRMKWVKGPLMYALAAFRSALASKPARMDVTFCSKPTKITNNHRFTDELKPDDNLFRDESRMGGSNMQSADDLASQVEMTKQTFSRDLLMLTLANGRVEGGNFEICPQADITDGYFDMVMVPPVNLFTLFTRLPLFSVGLQRFTTVIEYRKATHITVNLCPPLPMHVDGEQIGEAVSQLYAEIASGSLNLLVPA